MPVSIIIPALNEAAQIEAAIDNAWATGPLEVIVVDGGSRDDTATRARQRRCLLIESPSGRAVQMNRGARASSGDILLFLHADCRLDSTGLQQIETALQDPRVAGGAFRHRIEAGGLLYRLIERGDDLRVRWGRMAYGDQGIFLRRETFEQIGGFPEIKLMEDVYLIRKLRRRGRIVLLPGPLCTSARRWQKHGVIRQTLRNWSILLAERCGVSPNRLADYYRPHPPPS